MVAKTGVWREMLRIESVYSIFCDLQLIPDGITAPDTGIKYLVERMF